MNTPASGGGSGPQPIVIIPLNEALSSDANGFYFARGTIPANTLAADSGTVVFTLAYALTYTNAPHSFFIDLYNTVWAAGSRVTLNTLTPGNTGGNYFLNGNFVYSGGVLLVSALSTVDLTTVTARVAASNFNNIVSTVPDVTQPILFRCGWTTTVSASTPALTNGMWSF